MASEALEEKKPEEEAPVEDKHEVVEAGEDEEKEIDPPEVSEKATENEGEVAEQGEETPKKGKRGRKSSSKSETESKKRGGDSAAKKEKEPVTPVSERPTRERKVVERYSAPETGRSASTKPLSIEKGSGTQLKDIPNVAFKLSKRKPDENLQLLHSILFGKKAKPHTLKRNIVQFSGYVWTENEQEKQRTRVKEKLDKCVKEKLMDFCDVLNIQISKAGTKKEELSAKLLEFLESPHATTDVLLAEKEQKGQKRKKKVTPSKNAGSGDGSPETPAKKLKDTPSAEKNEESTKEEEDELDDKVEPSDSKENPLEEDDDDKMSEEADQGNKTDEEEDEPKDKVASPKSSSKDVKEGSKVKTPGKSTPAKKKTPAKSAKTITESEKKSRSSSKRGASDTDGASGSKAKGSVKKQKTEKESPKDSKAKATRKKQSRKSPAKVPAKDQVKGKTSKKAKAEPTKEDVHAVIVDILKEVDFNTATLSDILKQLGTHFGIDLMHRKAEVKDIITDVINNMTDEEEEDEEEAAGDDSEKENHDDA